MGDSREDVSLNRQRWKRRGQGPRIEEAGFGRLGGLRRDKKVQNVISEGSQVDFRGTRRRPAAVRSRSREGRNRGLTEIVQGFTRRGGRGKCLPAVIRKVDHGKGGKGGRE